MKSLKLIAMLVSAWVLASGAPALQAADYPFGLIELTLDKEGKGEGRLIGAAQIELKEGIVNVTSLGAQPVKLLSVRKR